MRLRAGASGVGVGVFSFMEVGMRFRRLSLGILLAAGLAAPAGAGVASKKFEWSPVNGLQDISVESDNVVVGQIEFDLGTTLKGTPIRKSSAKARLRVDNNGFLDEEVGVAVVVFDAEGNVVAAGSSGTKWGFLNRGDRTYYTIDFPYLYRRFDKAASFMISIETREKMSGSRKRRSRAVEPEPTPAP